MIIKSKDRLPILAADRDERFPVLPLRTGVLFPGMSLTLQVGRPENLKLVEFCHSSKTEFVATYSPSHRIESDNSPLSEVGVTAVVRDRRPAPGNSEIITIEGIRRVVLSEVVQTEPYAVAKARYIQSPASVPSGIKARIDQVVAVVQEICDLDPTYSPEQL